MIDIWTPLWVSLRAAFYATLIVTVLGVSLGYALARGRIPGRGILEAIATLPVALPPTVVGYYLATTLGGRGPIEHLSDRLLGHGMVFTFPGIVIAQAVESFPYCLRASRAAIAGVDRRYEQAARSMGLPGWRIALHVTLPLARNGIIAGVALAFGRALGDYGATLAISSGPATTTMPIELANQVFNGSPAAAQQLAYIQIAAAIVILVGISRLRTRRAW
jgi:molybdate transport system permease protein